MSKWPMQGHFRYLRFKTFPMTPRTPQCKVFWALLSNPKHSGVPEDSKSPTLGVLGFTPTLGQSGVATEDPDKVGFLGKILDMIIDRTRFGSDHRGLLTTGLDKTNLTRLELVPTLFGFLTTWFLVGLDRVFS